MSAEPVAEVSYSSWNGMNISVLAGVKTLPAGTPLYAQSPAQARAMAIAEAAKVGRDLYKGDGSRLNSYDEGWNDGIDAAEQAIRALSSPPSVSEEWVEKIAMEYSPTFSGIAMDAIKAALAALGVEVK